MQISQQCYSKVSILLEELYTSYLEFQENPSQYMDKNSSDGIYLGAIGAPPDLIAEMSEKYKQGECCIFQLYQTRKSQQLIEEISVIIRRANNINCLLSELKPIIKAVIYEYVNLRLEKLLQSDAKQEHPFELERRAFLEVLERRIQDFRKGFSKRVFEFPVVAFQLTQEIQLSRNISLVKIDPEELNQVGGQFINRFNRTRFYDVNFYLRTHISKKLSDGYARNLARKVEGVMIACVNLITSYQSSRTVSLISADQLTKHVSSFYRYGKDNSDMEYAQNYFFPTQIPESEALWNALVEGNRIQGSLANRVLSVPESMIELSDRKGILLERVERSLTWFRDAVNELDTQVRIQKVVTSIEALVNFSDDDTTKSFVRRLAKLNNSDVDCIDNIESKANELYNARSNIIHGSSVEERLSFNVIDFASRCLVLGIICFSLHGLGQAKNSGKLKAWLDS